MHPHRPVCRVDARRSGHRRGRPRASSPAEIPSSRRRSSSTRRPTAIYSSWPAWSTCWAPSRAPRLASRTRPNSRIRETSKRSPSASRWSTSPGRTTPSTSRGSTSIWRDFRPPGWPGPLLGWTTARPETHEPLTRLLFESEDDHPWWRFRRILDATNFVEGFARSDITRRELAPERLLVRARRRRRCGRARRQPRGREAAQPEPALLAADRSAPPRRRRRLPRPAPTGRRRRRNPGRARAGSLRQGVPAAPRRVHGARAAHRAIRSDPTDRSCSRTRWASAATGSISIRGSAGPAISTSAAGLSRSRSAP